MDRGHVDSSVSHLMQRNKLELLRQTALGAVLDDRHLGDVGRIATEVREPSGTVLFHEGAPANALWLLCSGSVALDMQVPARGAVRLQTLGPRDLLGWSALVGDGAMSTTATVTEDSQLLKLPAERIKDICISDHTLGYAVMGYVARTVANRLRGTRLQLLDLYSETGPSA